MSDINIKSFFIFALQDSAWKTVQLTRNEVLELLSIIEQFEKLRDQHNNTSTLPVNDSMLQDMITADVSFKDLKEQNEKLLVLLDKCLALLLIANVEPPVMDGYGV